MDDALRRQNGEINRKNCRALLTAQQEGELWSGKNHFYSPD